MSRQAGAPDELGFESAIAEALDLPVVVGTLDQDARRKEIERRIALLAAQISELESERFDLNWELGKLHVEEEGLFGPLDDDPTIEDIGIWPADAEIIGADDDMMDRVMAIPPEMADEIRARAEGMPLHEYLDRRDVLEEEASESFRGVGGFTGWRSK